MSSLDPVSDFPQFDKVWQLVDWLDTYATVYARPESDYLEQSFSGYTVQNARPQLIVDVDATEAVVACFVTDAQSPIDAAKMVSHQGRLIQCLQNPGKPQIPTDTLDTTKTPTHAVTLTQFAPFGHLFPDDWPTNTASGDPDVFESLPSTIDQHTLTAADTLQQNLEMANPEPPFDTPDSDSLEAGILIGNPDSDERIGAPLFLGVPFTPINETIQTVPLVPGDR